MRYFVPTPTGKYVGAALTPGLTRTAAGWSSRGQIYGQPGTVAIPAPPPAAVTQHYSGMARSGTSRSCDSPNVWFPSIYVVANRPQEHAPVSRVSDNQMPVPAKKAPNIIVARPYVTRKGGQRQVYQPQVVQSWLGMRGTPNG